MASKCSINDLFVKTITFVFCKKKKILALYIVLLGLQMAHCRERCGAAESRGSTREADEQLQLICGHQVSPFSVMPGASDRRVESGGKLNSPKEHWCQTENIVQAQ